MIWLGSGRPEVRAPETVAGAAAAGGRRAPPASAPGRLPPGWGQPAWPSASGRCLITGVPILCSKRSSRAISPSWLDRLASSGSPPSASSLDSFRGRALGTWISPVTKSAAAAAARPCPAARPRCGEPPLRECRRGPAPCRDGAGPGRSAQNSDSGTTDPAGRCRCNRC